jgi:hypothetical protein
MPAPTHFAVIARSDATKQSSTFTLQDFWIASLALAMTKPNACAHNDL